MAEQDKGKVFIILGLLLCIGLIPLIKAKLPEELEAEIIGTEFKRMDELK